MTKDIHSVLDEATNKFFDSLNNSGLDSEQLVVLTTTLFSNAVLNLALEENSDLRWIIHLCNETKDNILKEYFKHKKKSNE
jgi:hypothetical protein